jgi:hypothetical protein
MGCCDGTHIFSSQAGRAVAVAGDAATIAFAVDNDVLLFNDLMAIATSVGIQGQGGFQFMHALREFIYVYVFTERIGEIVVNGLAFPAVCNFGPQGPQTGPQAVCAQGISGLERIMTWYECNRITTRAEPITITLGVDVSYTAFLVGIKADIVNPETGIAQFSLRFNYVPVISDNDDFCFPLDDNCLDPPCDDEVPFALSDSDSGTL